MNTPSSPERYAKLILVPLILTSLWSPDAAGDTVTLDASRDNTIYEEDGSESSGSGAFLFAGDTGATNNGASRRALVFFDIVNGDGQNPGVPAGATIDDVTLTISVNKGGGGSQTMAIHKVTADWGEAGSTNAGTGGGEGGSAQTNDATWTHRFFNTAMTWTSAGGDFLGASDTSSIGTGQGSWSSAQMAADVKDWLDNSANNFGWIIIGNEGTQSTAKRFPSREGSSGPTLQINFTPAGGMMQDQTITFGALDDKFVDDADFEVSATASSGLTVEFSVESGPATISGTTVSLNGAEGMVTIRASQLGDANFNAAPNVDQSFDVSKRDQTITFDALINRETTDPPFDVAATSDSGLAVTFAIQSGPATIEGNTVTLTGEEGIVTVRASQAGDGVYNAAVDVDQMFNVGAPAPQDQTITFDPIADTTFGMDRVTLSATASSGLAVSYAVVSGPGLLNPDNSLSITGPGTVTIRASQAGDGSFNPAAGCG